MSDPTIPDELLTFNPADWPATPQGELARNSPGLLGLYQRELWRRAQDEWAAGQGLDRAGFEAIWQAQAPTPTSVATVGRTHPARAWQDPRLDDDE